MTGFVGNIEDQTKQNDYFRKVIFTAFHSQLVLMTIQPGEEIGMEVHPDNDQFFRFEEGKGKIIIAGEETEIEDNWAAVVPSGTEHNVINTGNEPLKLYTIYSPAHHPDGTIHKTKEEAVADEKAEHK